MFIGGRFGAFTVTRGRKQADSGFVARRDKKIVPYLPCVGLDSKVSESSQVCYVVTIA